MCVYGMPMDAQIKIMADISHVRCNGRRASVSRRVPGGPGLCARINRETESAIHLYLSLSRIFSSASAEYGSFSSIMGKKVSAKTEMEDQKEGR